MYIWLGDGSWWWMIFCSPERFPAGEHFFLYLRKNPQFQDILGVWSGRMRLIWETVCTGGQREGGTVLIMLLTDTTSKTVITNVKREKKENLYIQNVSCLIWQTLFLQYEIFICSTTRINVHELWLSTVNAAPGWFCEKILRKKQTDGSFRFLFFVPQQKQNW